MLVFDLEDSSGLLGAFSGHEPSCGVNALRWGRYEDREGVSACIGHPGCFDVKTIALPTVGKGDHTRGFPSTLGIGWRRLGASGFSVSAQNQPMFYKEERQIINTQRRYMKKQEQGFVDCSVVGEG